MNNGKSSVITRNVYIPPSRVPSPLINQKRIMYMSSTGLEENDSFNDKKK